MPNNSETILLFLLQFEINFSEIVSLNLKQALQDDLITDLSGLIAQFRLQRGPEIGFQSFNSVLEPDLLNFQIGHGKAIIHINFHIDPPVSLEKPASWSGGPLPTGNNGIQPALNLRIPVVGPGNRAFIATGVIGFWLVSNLGIDFTEVERSLEKRCLFHAKCSHALTGIIISLAFC